MDHRGDLLVQLPCVHGIHYLSGMFWKSFSGNAGTFITVVSHLVLATRE